MYEQYLSKAEGGIAAVEQRRVLFICTGNFYRSRFAEAVFNYQAKQHGLPWTAFSRGLAVHMVEGDMSPYCRTALDERGIDCSFTGSTRIQICEEDLECADLRIALKGTEHRSYVERMFPEWMDRIVFWEIHDIDRAPPAEALPQVEVHVTELVEYLRRRERELPATLRNTSS